MLVPSEKHAHGWEQCDFLAAAITYDLKSPTFLLRSVKTNVKAFTTKTEIVLDVDVTGIQIYADTKFNSLNGSLRCYRTDNTCMEKKRRNASFQRRTTFWKKKNV